MKVKITVLIILLMYVHSSMAQIQDKINIAVIDLDSRGGLSDTEIGILTDRLRSMLVRTNSFDVVDRGMMEEILKEQGFQMSGCTSMDCAVEAGKILGVEQMVSGTVGRLGSLYTVDIALIDVETSRIMKSLTRDHSGEIEGLIGIMQSVAEELAGVQKTAPVAGGSLDVSTKPDNADIYIDGVLKGKTPKKIDRITPGEHILKIQKQGYKTIEGKFTIVVNKTKEYDMDLKKLYTLSVSSNPSNAAVLINNKNVGQTPFNYEVEEDTRLSVKIVKQDYNVYTKNLHITDHEKLKVNLNPVATASKTKDQETEIKKDSGSSKTWLWIGAGAVAVGTAAFLLMPKSSSGDEPPVVNGGDFPLPPDRPQ